MPLDRNGLVNIQSKAGNRVAAGLATVQRQILDPAYADDVFDIAQGKREAEVSNMNLGSPKITKDDPRRQKLEAFFGEPGRRKGNATYRPSLPVGPRSRPNPTGQQVNTTLPKILVLGPPGGTTEAMEPEVAKAHQDLERIRQEKALENPGSTDAIDLLYQQALQTVTSLGRHNIRKTGRGIGTDKDSDRLGSKLNVVVNSFSREVRQLVTQDRWEDKVKAEIAFVTSRTNPDAAAFAIKRAEGNLDLAKDIYDLLYTAVGYDPDKMEMISRAGTEIVLMDMAALFPSPVWTLLLNAMVSSAELMTFAIREQTHLTSASDPTSVALVWHANSTAITSVVEAQDLLALTMVGGDAGKGVKAAKMLGTVSVPTLAKLQELDVAGVLTLAAILKLAAHGGDVTANHEMLAAGVTTKHCAAFNTKAGTTCEEIANRWAAIKLVDTDTAVHKSLVSSIALGDEATGATVDLITTNYDAMQDRTTVPSTVIARLIEAGVMRSVGKMYTSGTYGEGSIWVFEFLGGGRIPPEWHVHYSRQGKKVSVVGAGWKNKAQKFGVGVKTFDNAPSIINALKSVGRWKEPR